MSARRIGPCGAAVAIAFGLALVLPAAGGQAPALPGPAKAEAADCVPVQHSKRVVKRKKVRRHGKWVKVKRKRTVRWTTCEPPPRIPCAEPASSLGVTARDSSGSTFALSRPCVDAGAVSVQLNNFGEDPHNLFLSPSGPNTPPVHRLPDEEPFEVASLSQAEDTFVLTAGQWYVWCELLTHEQQGMYAYLTVS